MFPSCSHHFPIAILIILGGYPPGPQTPGVLTRPPEVGVLLKQMQQGLGALSKVGVAQMDLEKQPHVVDIC